MPDISKNSADVNLMFPCFLAREIYHKYLIRYGKFPPGPYLRPPEGEKIPVNRPVSGKPASETSSPQTASATIEFPNEISIIVARRDFSEF